MKTKLKQVDWENTSEYRELIMMKIIRAMKSYDYALWMAAELKKLGHGL